MILLVVVLVYFTNGEIRNAFFKEIETRNFTNDVHLSLSCGGRCLAESKCRSFVVSEVLKKCEISMDICKKEDDGVCYLRITDIPTGYSKFEERKKNILSQHPTSEERLLIVPGYTNRIPKVYDFQSKIIIDRPDLKLGKIRCLIFMRASTELLLAVMLPDRIQRYSTGRTKKTIANFKASLLAVDEDEKFVFMVKYRSNELYRTNLDIRKTVLRIFSSPAELFQLVSNMKAKQLYLASHRGIFVTSYNGKMLRTLAIGKSVRGLAFDCHDHILYYCHNFLGQYITAGGKMEKLFDMSEVFSSIVYHKGSLFVLKEEREDRLCEVIINSSDHSCMSLGTIYDDHQPLLTVVTTI